MKKKKMSDALRMDIEMAKREGFRVEKLDCQFLCHEETPHKINGHEFTCLVCGFTTEKVYCHRCSQGASPGIFHFPPVCDRGEFWK